MEQAKVKKAPAPGVAASEKVIVRYIGRSAVVELADTGDTVVNGECIQVDAAFAERLLEQAENWELGAVGAESTPDTMEEQAVPQGDEE